MSFVDLHVHFLPGVDDGPATLEDTVAMLRLAHRGGTRVVVATSHLYSPAFPEVSPSRLRTVFVDTVQQLRALSNQAETSFLSDMTFYLGAEHYLSPELLAALDTREILPVGASEYLLVEFPHGLPLSAMLAAARRIRAAGLVPMLAHVERYEAFRKRPRELEALLALGCVAQVNGRGLAGGRGRRDRSLIRLLLERGLAQVVASDGHDAGPRPPVLEPAVSHLQRRFSDDSVTSWVSRNPKRILASQPVGRA